MSYFIWTGKIWDKTRIIRHERALQLKETICDKCIQGRKSMRPVLEMVSICRDSPETVCVNSTTGGTWKKWCRDLFQVSSGERQLSVPAIIGVWPKPNVWQSKESEESGLRLITEERQYNNIVSSQTTSLNFGLGYFISLST